MSAHEVSYKLFGMTKTQGFPQDLYGYLGPKWVFGSGGWTKNDMDF